MPTLAQRCKAYADALTNRDTPQDVVLQMIESGLGMLPDEVAAMSLQDRMRLFLSRARQQRMREMHAYQSAADRAAVDAAALATVQTNMEEAQ